MHIAISNAGKDWRGTETDTWLLASGLSARGHEVLILCRPGSKLESKFLERPFARSPAGAIAISSTLSARDFDPIAIMRTRRALGRHGTQLVITQKDKDLRLSGIAARTRGIPVLVRHVTDRPLKNTWRYRLLFGRVATHHLANSHATLATLRTSAPWLTDPVPVIHNGIDVRACANAKPADLALPADAVVVGYIGAFERRKGILDFAKAWQRVEVSVPNAHAVIAGAGARAAEFRNALGSSPRIHWLGFRNDVPELMKALDIFVMPSLFEGFGLVLAEAMAAGVPPVAYAASNLPELVENGVTGLLVEAGDSAALAEAVSSLARDSEKRARMGAAAQKHATEHFSADRMVDEHERLIAQIIGASHGGA